MSVKNSFNESKLLQNGRNLPLVKLKVSIRKKFNYNCEYNGITFHRYSSLYN